jgi:hypothetical protein
MIKRRHARRERIVTDEKEMREKMSERGQRKEEER